MKTLTLMIAILTLTVNANRKIDEAVCMNSEETKLYKLIMDYRKELGLYSIPMSSKLTKVAQVHAKDLEENHDPENGKCNLHSWSKKGKWTSCCYTPDHKQAECMWNKPKEIAGYESHGYEISYFSEAGANADQGITGWKKSKSHNEVMTNKGIWKDVKWNAIGIGIYKGYGVVWFGELEDSQKPDRCK